MQKYQIPPHSVPIGKLPPQRANVIEEGSPTYAMAKRIRSEQGIEQVKRFLLAVEPFIAPAEQEAIANVMGITLEKCHAKADAGNAERESFHQANPQPQQQTSGFNIPPLFSALMQSGGQQSGGMNPLMLAQLMGMMNGKK